MQVNIEVYNGAELVLLGEMMSKLGALRLSRESHATTALFPANEVPADTSPVPADVVVTEKLARKPRAKKAEQIEIPLEVTTVTGPIEPEPVAVPTVTAAVEVPAPAVTAWDKPTLEGKTRDLAKTNYPAAKALLESFNVKRFGELPAEKYQAYGTALAAL